MWQFACFSMERTLSLGGKTNYNIVIMVALVTLCYTLRRSYLSYSEIIAAHSIFILLLFLFIYILFFIKIDNVYTNVIL